MAYSTSDEWQSGGNLKHSGFGIASFAIGILSGLAEFAMVVIAGVMEASTPGGVNEEAPAVILLGLCLIGGGLALLGIVLGIVGLVQANRSKIFAVLGLVFNALVILGVIGLMIVGIAMGQPT